MVIKGPFILAWPGARADPGIWKGGGLERGPGKKFEH